MASKWINAKLGEYIDSCLGKMLDKQKNRGDFHPYLGNKNVRWGNFDLDDLAEMRFEKHEHERYGLEYGDLIVCEGGEPGRCAIWRDQIPGMKIQKALHRVRTKPGLNNVYLYYWFMYAGRYGLLEPYFTGTTIKHLTGKSLSELDISIPPLSHQEKVAYLLGGLDEKIELNRQMNETLEQMAQALFKSWFVDFDPVIDNALDAGNPIPEELEPRAEQRRHLRDAVARGEASVPSLPDEIRSLFPREFELTDEMEWIPKGWKSCTFGDVSECLDKHRVPLSKKQREEKKPGSVPYYGATSVMDYINEWIFDGIYLLVGEDGSVVKNDGSPFVQYIWGKTWVNNHAHVLKGKGDVSTEHLMLFMKDQNLNAYVTGAVQLKINQKNMNRIPFVKASMEINQYFSEWIDSVYSKVRALTEEMMTLTTLRDSLLPKLISGELQIPDAEQQIAAALS